MGRNRCKECRYWSEMLAQVENGLLTAMCLAADGPYRNQFTSEQKTCDAWKSGHHGAVDAPPNYGEQQRAAYEREESDGC